MNDSLLNSPVFPLSVTMPLSFHGQDYQLTVDATDERLTLLVEDRFDVSMWRGDFTSVYLEELTRKTGKGCTYPVFVHMLATAAAKDNYFLDLLGFDELQLLKARREYTAQSGVKNPKKYLIVTHVAGKDAKVHYPLPLNPVETGAFLMDKDTMKRLVRRMSQTLSEFSSQAQMMRQTKEFFSRENSVHPVVEDNALLRHKLSQLEEARLKGGAVSMNTLQAEKDKVEQDYKFFQTMTEKEIRKLRTVKEELRKQIQDMEREIRSERPQSGYSQLSYSQQQ